LKRKSAAQKGSKHGVSAEGEEKVGLRGNLRTKLRVYSEEKKLLAEKTREPAVKSQKSENRRNQREEVPERAASCGKTLGERPRNKKEGATSVP